MKQPVRVSKLVVAARRRLADFIDSPARLAQEKGWQVPDGDEGPASHWTRYYCREEKIMSNAATIGRRTVEHEDFRENPELEAYLNSLSPEELRQLASYARKKAAGMEDPARKPGGEGGSWLRARYVRGSGPYFYLYTYVPADVTSTDSSGYMSSGRAKTQYVGRHLPAHLAEKFGYSEGVTPEETDVHIIGTHRHGDKHKKSE